MSNKDTYIDFVLLEASKAGKVFVLDSGEGRVCTSPETDWDIEDLSGWLVNPHEVDALWDARNNDVAYEAFSDSYVFAIWSKSDLGKIKVTFKNAESFKTA